MFSASRLCRSTLLVATACLAFPAEILAQENKDGDAAQNSIIIVTAQKKVEDISDVPFSVDAISGSRLADARAGGEDLLFLAARSPSLYAESSSGRIFPRFYIRGLGNTDFDLNANGPVSVLLDEVPLENPILRGFPLFDVERVEVLRGPQGTLFGRNTPAGAVKIETAKPTEETSGFVRAAYGRFDTVDLEAGIGGSLGGGFTARLSGQYQRRDDYVDNSFFPAGGEEGFEEFEDIAGRLQVQYEDAGTFKALLSVFGRDLDGGSRVFRANAIRPGVGGLVADFDRFETAQDATQILGSNVWGISLRTERKLGNFTLNGVSSYSEVRVNARGDVDGGFGASFAPPFGPGFIPFPAESADNITGHNQRTSEIRLSGPIAPNIDILIGGFYFKENLEIENLSFDTLSGGALNGRAVQDQDTTALAAFGSLTAKVTPQLTVTGGLRLSYERKNFEVERLVGPFGAPPLGPINRRLTSTNLSGDVSATYDVTDDVSGYIRYARSFRAPNAQGRIVFGDAVTTADTETIDSIEAGIKGRFWNGKGRFSTAVFYYVTNDQQLTAVGGAGNFNQLLNADKVRGHGFEAEVSLDPAKNFSINAGVSLNNTRIDDPGLEVGICGAPCTVLDPINAVTGNALIDGNPLPQAPRWIVNGSARYSLPAGSGEFFSSADFAYRSNINFFLYESTEFRDRSLFEVGARAGYLFDGGKYELSVFGRNIFNDTSIEGAIDFNNFSAFVNEPTIYGIEAKARF
ncbi:TonB-dependent receptor [Sphingorhabdus arenilitoris]|uniref:TonB-dependent receptor n=1 Tax=Sphingorhabdus arenilitoris TaxID=1490041 RepID=A0ABV8RDI1_9SPHN